MWIGIAGLLLLAAAPAPFGMYKKEHFPWQWIAAVLAACVSFIFAVQKQSLDDLKLFLDLFEKYNRKYDRLNDALNAMASGEPLKDNKLNDYFNLCGEQYLLYREGHIHPEVWQTWRKGMGYFFLCRRIRKEWKKEFAQNSYYGLNAIDLEAAAREVHARIMQSKERPPSGFELPSPDNDDDNPQVEKTLPV